MNKKMIAPIIIGIIAVLYYLVFFAGIIMMEVSILFKIMLGVFPLFLAIGMIVVVWTRVKEIKGGEEDDLSKY